MDQAFQYVKDNQGLDSEDSYPYLGTVRPCPTTPSSNSANDTGFVDIPRTVSVAIDAGHDMCFIGIYYEKDCSSEELDHVCWWWFMALREKMWMARNTGFEKWGDKGYIYMAKDRKNHCGIATAASYPLV
uniref:Cathepsin La n=1 Tax=Sphaeramia orbicularis TaxID=375764 RepID=A0A673C071_9TELE